MKPLHQPIRVRVGGCGAVNLSPLATDDHSCEVNWLPLSDDMSIEMPKQAIQCVTRAFAQL